MLSNFASTISSSKALSSRFIRAGTFTPCEDNLCKMLENCGCNSILVSAFAQEILSSRFSAFNLISSIFIVIPPDISTILPQSGNTYATWLLQGPVETSIFPEVPLNPKLFLIYFGKIGRNQPNCLDSHQQEPLLSNLKHIPEHIFYSKVRSTHATRCDSLL